MLDKRRGRAAQQPVETCFCSLPGIVPFGSHDAIKHFTGEIALTARSDQWPARYRIRISGHLDPAWSGWFDGLTITQQADGTTTLVGLVVDQAALFGLLARLRDLGATLLSVERLAPDSP